MDLPSHDLHHYGRLETGAKSILQWPDWANWANSAYSRRAYEAWKRPGWERLTNIWGLFTAINTVFEVYASLDPNDPELANRKPPANDGSMLM